MNRSHSYGRTSDKIAKAAITILILAMVGVVAFVGFQFYNMPEYATDREINSLAKDYYENYFYDEFVANVHEGNGSLEEAFGDYGETGIGPIRLRQLFLFDNGRHQSSADVFSDPHYTCDTNLSSVTYHPSAPYGKTDYTYEVNLSCKK